MADPPPNLVVVVGATAVGKTRTALDMATAFRGEIVNGDATAMYRLLDVGSAKPTACERAEVPHHLVDVADPDELIAVSDYQEMAYAAIDEIATRGGTPFLVGGSGLFMRSVMEGYCFPPTAPDAALRERLETEAGARGGQWLHARLSEIDPVAAGRIHPNNIRRMVRALEVFEDTGKPISHFWETREPRYTCVTVGLMRDREELWDRVDQRVDAMFLAGLADEVRGILERGYAATCPALRAIGYRQVVPYVRGEIGEEEARDAVKSATRRLARQQLTSWFRADDPGIRWFAVGADDLREQVHAFLAARGV